MGKRKKPDELPEGDKPKVDADQRPKKRPGKGRRPRPSSGGEPKGGGDGGQSGRPGARRRRKSHKKPKPPRRPRRKPGSRRKLPDAPRPEDEKVAKKLLEDAAATEAAAKESESKANRVKKLLGEAYDLVLAFGRLVTAYVRGDYRDISWRTIAKILAAIAYFLAPFDIIPDFFVLVGYSDDVALVLAVAASVKKDLDAFLEWERKQAKGPTAGEAHEEE